MLDGLGVEMDTSPSLRKRDHPTAPTAGSPGLLGLSRLWRGELPLWEAFWLYFVVGSLLTSALGLLLATAVQYAVENVILGHAIGGTGTLVLYVLLSLLAPALYQAFAGIGAWRSASWRHLSGILARVWIALAFASLFLLFVIFIYVLTHSSLPNAFSLRTTLIKTSAMTPLEPGV